MERLEPVMDTGYKVLKQEKIVMLTLKSIWRYSNEESIVFNFNNIFCDAEQLFGDSI